MTHSPGDWVFLCKPHRNNSQSNRRGAFANEPETYWTCTLTCHCVFAAPPPPPADAAIPQPEEQNMTTTRMRILDYT